jgi:hypothetical protein
MVCKIGLLLECNLDTKKDNLKPAGPGLVSYLKSTLGIMFIGFKKMDVF